MVKNKKINVMCMFDCVKIKYEVYSFEVLEEYLFG